MIRLSIKRKIIGIAVVLIVLMAITALVSLALVLQVGGRLEDLTQSYVPAYGALARANIRSLDRALALRRMVIEKRAKARQRTAGSPRPATISTPAARLSTRKRKRRAA